MILFLQAAPLLLLVALLLSGRAGPVPAVLAALAAAVPAVVGLLIGARRLARVGVVAALVTGLLGTGAYAVATASVAHTGSIPSVGTSSGMMMGADHMQMMMH
jgi:hypothetical protein